MNLLDRRTVIDDPHFAKGMDAQHDLIEFSVVGN
jgi:hypothetical protein